MSLTKKILIALVLGVVTGIILTFVPEAVFSKLDTYLLTPVGQIFINLIMMLVVPIVFVSIVLGTAGLGEPAKLGRIGIQTITFFLVTTAIALCISLALAFAIKPGTEGVFDVSIADYEVNEAPPIMETLVNIIPTNPVSSMAAGDMLQIIAFAIFVGIALAILGDKTSGIHRLFNQANEVLMYLVNVIMKAAPYGAFALIASAIGGAGLDAIGSMGAYMGTVILGLFIHAAVTYTIAIWFLGRGNPITFYKGFFPAMSVAFSTASSNATLPISMKAAQENLGVSKSISSFVQPLGATVNMDGTAIMQATAAVFISQVYAIPLDFTDIILIIITATLASIGTAGVPGVGLIMLAMVLTQVGLPVEGIALIIGIDRLLDMLRTSLNITGDAVCAYIISENEKRKGKVS
ncbi:dicarboxylate/amino acid:cation symporter [Bacilli bacterium]|uniref:dicarboxylate/amino acid:cation symporter n=1 Tax=Oceanobacillus caeni TaxID=405946 RepID=UPI00062186DD|nr:dicarboxylate/amino acid:cation symporter [Oceanobacillus caeni]KKE80473.1 sodium:dicarboxylate symporter [Bacilli bacterium VT-13-104]PZD83188.1 dicarboxylate/amino acid:cation symporter [Bacilli bacterium]MBU8790721.1 dicarboxylate/amino acid:cation symporter [Oceanobacillus caeni]PZD84394.1 dicarboxylate/amino acid:cation symporter [Bacilli bacterium]PZD86390.1 dicarboxylate/amino acid:cation symporter [Bacilli bacterium]